ncbi:MAG: hypothetical protein R2747_20390 [Pyrinomonadaceae bacterium]
MKNKNYLKITSLTVVMLIVSILIACQSQKAGVMDVNSIGNASSPTEAYIMLYSAVKSKNTEAIKKMMSKASLKFAEGVSGQQKKPIEKVLENGFYRSTMNPEMPEIRDERIKDDKYGAVEAFVKENGKWEQAYFIKEDDGWKVAVGDIFAGTFQQPPKSQAQIQADQSNANKYVPYAPNVNGNFTSGPPPQKKPEVNTAQVQPEKPAESNKSKQ